MKIYLDCGTHLGQGIEKHISKWKIDETWKIVGFEANPFTFAKLIKRRENSFSNWMNWPQVEFVHAAIWIHSKGVEMGCSSYQMNEKEFQNPLVQKWVSGSDMTVKKDIDSKKIIIEENTDGSSSILYRNMAKYLSSRGNIVQKMISYNEFVQVPSLDFSEYVQQLKNENNKIYCKMDIEQAEFKVLLKMIRDKTLACIDILDIEWHNFANLKLKIQKIYIRYKAKKLGVKIENWE